MSTSTVAIPIDHNLLAELDQLVKKGTFSSRNKAIQLAVTEMISRLRHKRLAEECAKLDPKVEKAMAEEGMSNEIITY